MAEIAMQFLLVFLLVMTITWCVIVHHRLRRLRADQGEMEAFVKALDGASGRAEAAVERLREAAGEARAAILEEDERAQRRIGELKRHIEGGGRLLRRLESALESCVARTAELRTQGETRREENPPEPRPEMPKVAVGRTAASVASSSDSRRSARDELLQALEALR